MVLAEVVWVLESFYRLSRTGVQERAMAIVSMDGLTLPEADIIGEALVDYREKNIDFIDSYNACWMRTRNLDCIVTFDRGHLSRIDGISVYVPGAD